MRDITSLATPLFPTRAARVLRKQCIDFSSSARAPTSSTRCVTRYGPPNRHSVQWQSRFELLFGGQRTWFSCPNCQRRVARLYGGKYFRCRDCYGLAYTSQRQAPMWRLLRKAQKIRQRFGEDASPNSMFPKKSTRMHWRTFKRLVVAAETTEARCDLLADAWAKMKLK